MVAQTNTRIWLCRTAIKSLRDSYTYYDADLRPISTNNAEPRPIRNYYHDVEMFDSTNKTMENLIWLISSAKDESLLVLHQNIQGKNNL